MLAADGSVLAEEVVRYYRHNPKSGIAYFSREFDVPPEDVYTVRAIHRGPADGHRPGLLPASRL